MVYLLILFHWDLHKLSREPFAHLALNHAQVLFHPFPLCLVVTVDVPDHNLQIAVYDCWHGPYCFNQVEA